MKEERAIKRKRRKIKFWAKFMIFLIFCGAVAFLLKAPLFEVKEFVVEGNHYYTAGAATFRGAPGTIILRRRI